MTTSDTKEAPSLNGSAKEKSTQASTESSPPPKRDANWPSILYFLYLHPLALCALYLGISDACWSTLLFGLAVILVSLLGVTAGAHRLWAHKAYKASTKLKILLMLAHTLAGQGTIYEWVKQHRKHHKYFGTHKDPHNPKRGFLYAHFVSNLQKKTEEDERDTREIDMSDIDKDDVVMFQKKYYWIIFILVSLILPLNAPLEYWDESLMNCVLIIAALRFTIMLHAVWFIHSSTLVWGLQPNDKKIKFKLYSARDMDENIGKYKSWLRERSGVGLMNVCMHRGE